MTLPSLFVDGKPVQLGKRIGRGGEGDVFVLEGSNGYAVKYYTVTDARSREEKICAMVAARLAEQSDLVAFPIAVARRKNGDFAGFLMRLISGYKPLFN